jgi:hypothetical protein
MKMSVARIYRHDRASTLSESILGLVGDFDTLIGANEGVREPNGVPGRLSPGVAGTLLLCFMCAWIR